MTHPADRLLEKRFGIFNHFLYGDPGEGGETDLVDYDWDARVAALDVDYIARQLHQMGAGYYCITLLQGKKYTIAPNATFDRIAGTRPGEACARRDLVAPMTSTCCCIIPATVPIRTRCLVPGSGLCPPGRMSATPLWQNGRRCWRNMPCATATG